MSADSIDQQILLWGKFAKKRTKNRQYYNEAFVCEKI